MRRFYDYALIRIVPRVEREEFINAGVIVFCRTQRYLDARIELNLSRLLALAPAVNHADIAQHLALIPRICAGEHDAGPIALLPVFERFHWLTSPRSTVVQPSPVHSGIAGDPAAALEHLFATVVLLPER